MGRIVVEQHISADGFVATSDGGLDWVAMAGEPAPMTQWELDALEHTDAILLGRRTYEMFVSFWPTEAANADPLKGPINARDHHVFSTTLDSAPWGDHPPATVHSGDPAAAADALKARYDQDVIVWGSLQLAGALLEAGRVDQLRLRVAPVALGAGTPLWRAGIEPHRLELTDTQALSTGQVTLEYTLG